mmetsp:Transcript_11909/g.30618  ORF Transcript_11909/g.30618 Transcript_11909/m.30618 type:complete len:211 (+) Transcript_11909:3109-3741(+)
MVGHRRYSVPPIRVAAVQHSHLHLQDPPQPHLPPRHPQTLVEMLKQRPRPPCLTDRLQSAAVPPAMQRSAFAKLLSAYCGQRSTFDPADPCALPTQPARVAVAVSIVWFGHCDSHSILAVVNPFVAPTLQAIRSQQHHERQQVQPQPIRPLQTRNAQGYLALLVQKLRLLAQHVTVLFPRGRGTDHLPTQPSGGFFPSRRDLRFHFRALA